MQLQIHRPIHASIIHPSIHPSILPWHIHLIIHLSIYLSVCLSVHPSIPSHPIPSIPSHPSHPSLFLSVGLTKTTYPRHHTCLSRNGHGGKPQPMEEILQKLGTVAYPVIHLTGFKHPRWCRILQPSTVSFSSPNFTNAKSRMCIFSFYTLQTQSPYGWSKLGIPINRCCFLTKHCTRICGSLLGLKKNDPSRYVNHQAVSMLARDPKKVIQPGPAFWTGVLCWHWVSMGIIHG